MSFDYQVKADAREALAASTQVEGSLHKIGTTADQLRTSITNAFNAQAIRDANGAIIATSVSITSLKDKAAGTANAFSGLANAIRLEREMLERIHGPSQQAERDMMTLDALMLKGAISAQQYAAELARIGRAAGFARGNPVDAVSLPSASGPRGGGGGGVASSLSGALGLAGGVAGGVAVAKQVLDLSDSYTSLENRLRQVAGSQDNLNTLMARTREIADETRSDWSATAESYVRLTNATKQMGLSQERGLAITQTLNMALQSSGASSSEAAAGTLQLMQALAAGALQGDEFRSIAEQLPDLLDVFAQEMGVSRGELKKLGSEGKITADVVVRSLEHASGTIRDKFNASTETASQTWTVLKNQLTESAGEFVRNAGVMDMLKGAASGLSTVLEVVGGAVGLLRDGLDALGPVGDVVTTVIRGIASPVTYAKDAVVALTASVTDIVLETQPLPDEIARVVGELQQLHDQLDSGMITSVEQFTDRMTKLHTQLAKPYSLQGIVGEFVSGRTTGAALSKFSMLFDDPWGTSAVEKGLRVLGFRSKAELDASKRAAKDALVGFVSFDGFKELEGTGLTDRLKEAVAAANELQASMDAALGFQSVDMDKFGAGIKVKTLTDDMEDAVKAGRELDETFKKAMAEVQQTQGSMGDVLNGEIKTSAQTIASTVMDAVKGVDVSLTGVLERIADGFAAAIAQALILRAITGSYTGATMPNGGGYVGGLLGAIFGGNRSTGGEYIAPGVGGGDSVPVLFNMKAGEKARLTPPESAAREVGGGGYGGGAPVNVTVVNRSDDPRALVSHLDSPEGDRVIDNYMRRRRRGVRRLLD